MRLFENANRVKTIPNIKKSQFAKRDNSYGHLSRIRLTFTPSSAAGARWQPEQMMHRISKSQAEGQYAINASEL